MLAPRQLCLLCALVVAVPALQRATACPTTEFMDTVPGCDLTPVGGTTSLLDGYICRLGQWPATVGTATFTQNAELVVNGHVTMYVIGHVQLTFTTITLKQGSGGDGSLVLTGTGLGGKRRVVGVGACADGLGGGSIVARGGLDNDSRRNEWKTGWDTLSGDLLGEGGCEEAAPAGHLHSGGSALELTADTITTATNTELVISMDGCRPTSTEAPGGPIPGGGGGVISITAPTLQARLVLSASGAAGLQGTIKAAGGGAGGLIKIVTDSSEGSGHLDVLSWAAHGGAGDLAL